MPNSPASLLGVTQAAEELHLTPRAVRHRIRTGTLGATKTGPGTAGYVITREEIERVKSDTKAAS